MKNCSFKYNTKSQNINFDPYQNVINFVPLLSAKFEHLLPV